MLIIAEAFVFTGIFTTFEILRRYKLHKNKSTLSLDDLNETDIVDAKLIY